MSAAGRYASQRVCDTLKWVAALPHGILRERMCRLSSTMLMNSWNLLDEAWLEVSSPHGAWRNASPLESLRSAGEIRCIGSSSPLDEYAAIRFLTTLLYWKADAAGGVVALRESLIAGKMPPKLVEAIALERARFDLFDPKIPFLQDPSIGPNMGRSPSARSSPRYQRARTSHTSITRGMAVVPSVLRASRGACCGLCRGRSPVDLA